MPEQMGTHWSGGDVPDDHTGKFAGTFVTATVLMIMIAVSLAVNVGLTKIFAKNYNSRKPILFFDCFIILLSTFLLITYVAGLAWNAGADFSMPKFISTVAGVLTALTLIVIVYVLTRKSKNQEKTLEAKVDYVPSTGEYKDSLIEIRDDTIVFKNYYFPTGSKSVRLSQVEYVEEKPPTLRNGKWRLHGTGDFKTWFPADYDRPNRDKIFVMKVKGKWIRIGFTVENSYAISGLFKANGLLGQEKHHDRQSCNGC
jgi:hypothetical protein